MPFAPNVEPWANMITTLTIDVGQIARAVKLRSDQVETVISLLDDGNTVPFITRYRKDQTGGLDEVQIRSIGDQAVRLRMLADRKQTILRSIESQGKLTSELAAQIEAAHSTKRLDDLYLPFKPKKQTLATVARERGLEPLADEILAAVDSCADLDARAAEFIDADGKVPTSAEALLGAGHIIAERYSEHAELRRQLRTLIQKTGKLVGSKLVADEKKSKPYADYFEYSEDLRKVPPHRVLAINRGERAKVLRIKVDADTDSMQQSADKLLLDEAHPHIKLLRGCVRDALARLVLPSLECEARRELTESAEVHAIGVFARNLRNLLLQPPIHGRRVLAIDPGFRSGCKLAVLDEFGSLIDHGIIYIIGKPQRKVAAKVRLAEMIRKHRIDVLAIGNGTACRESEQLVAELIADLAEGKDVSVVAQSVVSEKPRLAPTEKPVASECESAANADVVVDSNNEQSTPNQSPPADEPVSDEPVADEPVADEPVAEEPAVEPQPLEPKTFEPIKIAYVIVNEAGASVYSTSALGREEFPQYDATLRGAISIGRRLLDPLSELVKIEPANIGVGLYQHDVKTKQLRDSLDAVVESCVNYVGVDLNTASPALLRYVSGLNQLTARRLFEFRSEHGPFISREQLKEVPGLGEATFIQAAGFLRIVGGKNPLDASWIHPESYEVAAHVLEKMENSLDDLADPKATAAIAKQTAEIDVKQLSDAIGVGLRSLRDILSQLGRPGRDPREGLPAPIFKQGVLKLEDLSEGMELTGTVLNVVDFGAFIDVGLHDSGLVHVSQLANRFVRDPHEVISVGDIVHVWVTSIDKDRRRVGLTMVKPGTPKQDPRRRRGKGSAKKDEAQAETGQPSPDKPRDGQSSGEGNKRPPRKGRRSGDRKPGDRKPGNRGKRPSSRTYPSKAPHRPKPKPKPKPLVPITKAMKEGREPMRTFGDLMQFVKKEDDPKASDKKAD